MKEPLQRILDGLVSAYATAIDPKDFKREATRLLKAAHDVGERDGISEEKERWKAKVEDLEGRIKTLGEKLAQEVLRKESASADAGGNQKKADEERRPQAAQAEVQEGPGAQRAGEEKLADAPAQRPQDEAGLTPSRKNPGKAAAPAPADPDKQAKIAEACAKL